MVQTDEFAGGRLTEKAFSERLSILKRHGSSLLVVGLVPDEHRVQACRRMLGDASERPRRRIVVESETASVDVEKRLPPSTGSDQAEATDIITYTTHERQAASRTAPTDSTKRSTHVDGQNLTRLGIVISETIDEFEEQADDLDPAEIRVCFDSLRSLLGEHDEKDVFRFLHVLTGRIKSVRGMGHVHLSGRADSRIVNGFAPLFDAVVEVRYDDGRLEQRWQFRDEDRTSPWIPL